jgi:hypothetical protein
MKNSQLPNEKSQWKRWGIYEMVMTYSQQPNKNPNERGGVFMK